MKCPDCGAPLSELNQHKNWWLYRCFRCGGVLTNSETLNSITSADLVAWRRVGVDPRWLTGGDDKSPIDGMKMERYRGDEIPPEINVKRSPRTGTWWLPGNTIFDLKEAQSIKVQYSQTWGLPAGVKGLALPVVVTALLFGGVWLGARLVKERQLVAVPASSGQVVMEYKEDGKGRLWVDFAVGSASVEYKQHDTTGLFWKKAELIESYGMGSVYRTENLMLGVDYDVRIGSNYIVVTAKK